MGTGMIVYCITNLVNGKKYVGQTGRSLAERWKEHCASSRQPSRTKQCPYLYAAMNAHGIENFEITEIDRAENANHLDDLEELWITKLGTTDRNRGYNISFGGSSRPNSDTRAKLSASLKGKPAWNKGRPMGEEHYKNTVESAKKRRGIPLPITPQGRRSLVESKLGENNPNFGGKSITEATILRMRNSHLGKAKGKDNPMFRKDISDEAIRQLRSIGFSQQKIADILGCNQVTVSNRLRTWAESVAA